MLADEDILKAYYFLHNQHVREKDIISVVRAYLKGGDNSSPTLARRHNLKRHQVEGIINSIFYSDIILQIKK